ncbi:MAG: DUF3459 domain-containing protein [Acidobacteriaceae bacterium]|nr:DUF3459 domain-containing protein [Acidobacteriaceae bacterium]
MRKCLDDPSALATFERSQLNHDEVQNHAETYAVHRDLLRLRREDPVISRQGAGGIDGAVLSSSCFVVRFFTKDFQQDRLLIVNLGADLELNPAPEPLLGPLEGTQWTVLWSSDNPQYGGCGTAPLDSDDNWKIPGQAAVVLYPVPAEE